jgi:uncharacterized protein (DUF924 family)
MWIDEVLKFWFEELQSAAWFTKDAAIDAQIRNRFERLHEQLSQGDIQVPATPRAYLAAVIVLDQFSRNMFRGTAKAFASDAKALAFASRALDAGFDREMTKEQRQFLYLPFMHSEELAVQMRCVELYAAFDDAELMKYATEHRDIIERFRRFPHRNAALARESTPAEIEFMQKHPGF